MDNEHIPVVEETAIEEPVIKAPIKAIKDSLFLAMCIVMTVSVALAFDVITLLYTIGMWICYASAKKEQSILSGVSLCAGTSKASYIISWVLAIILAVMGVIMIVCAVPLSAFGAEAVEDLRVSYEEFNEIFMVFLEPLITTSEISVSAFILILFIAGGIAAIISAAISAIIVVLFAKKLVAFLYSVKGNIESDAPIVNAGTIRIWILILGIFEGISALSAMAGDFTTGLGGLASCAAFIIGYQLMKKHF